jgi:hypothetical protein
MLQESTDGGVVPIDRARALFVVPAELLVFEEEVHGGAEPLTRHFPAPSVQDLPVALDCTDGGEQRQQVHALGGQLAQ